MKNWPEDEARIQFLCSELRERNANELSYDNKVQFWVDFTQKFCEEKKILSFTISDLEQYVLSLCPYRPLCLSSIFEADNESSIILKENYESSLTWKSWSYSMITSPLRTIQTYSPLRGKQKPNFVHKKAVESIVANCKELLDQKQKEDPTWNVISYEEFTELTNIQSSDFSLYFKVSKLSHDPEFKMIKLDGDGKISANDMVWPKIRFMLKQLKEKTDKLETNIKNEEILIRSKIRNKADRKILLQLMKRKKKLEKTRDDLFEKEINLQDVLDNYRQALENRTLYNTLKTANEDLEKINKDVNIDEVHNLMDSLVEAKEDIDEIGGALATDIIPDANLFDQELEDELENLLKSEEKDDIADLMNSCAISANIPSPGGAGDTPNVDSLEDNLPDLL